AGIAPGVRIELAVMTGVAFKTINEAAASWGADLIVMGAHRRNILRNVLIGTTIERVIRTGRHPVLMANLATFVPYESVLLALDTSSASAAAAHAACDLGLLDKTHVAVIHAFEPLYKGMLGWAGVREQNIDEYSA